ncbi:MAG: hypothetical protein IPL90_13775 [Holophagales bacterium]|nr:hypothetical protein [Holophagales bacterium]
MQVTLVLAGWSLPHETPWLLRGQVLVALPLLVNGEVSWSATDALALTLGADVPYGSRYGPFGSRPDLKRVRAGVRSSF